MDDSESIKNDQENNSNISRSLLKYLFPIYFKEYEREKIKK